MREERADWNCKDGWLVSHDHPGTCPAPSWVTALVSLALWHNSTLGQELCQPKRKLSCEMQKKLRSKAIYKQGGNIHCAYTGSTYICMCNLFYFIFFYFKIFNSYMRFQTWTHLPPHNISLGHPHAPAPRMLHPASDIDWRFNSYMIVYMLEYKKNSFWQTLLAAASNLQRYW